MEMKPTQETGHLLPCGRSVEGVWDDLEAGRVTDHALNCPHCTTARAGLDELTEATRALIDDPAEPPTGFLDKIMTAVRADLSLGQTVRLPAPTARVNISTYALAAVLRYAVDGVDGIRAHECRVEVSPGNSRALKVWISVAVRFGSGPVSALDEARSRVAAALPERIGLELQTLDFEVVDVWIDQAVPKELP